MLLNVVSAKYLADYSVLISFSNGVEKIVDLKETIFHDHRAIFQSLKEVDYFKQFHLAFNTIVWQNQADFAPEFLYDIGRNV